MNEFVRPIKEGPPKDVQCPECGEKMYQNYGCNFVLKGAGWAGKEAKHGGKYYEDWKERERDEKRADEIRIAEGEAEEVMRHRNMGKKASKHHRERNPHLWKRYRENLRKGVGKNAGKKS